jgi:uncharacterized membrane protein
MGWNRRYAIVSYLCSSLWTVPLFALVVEQIGIRFLTIIDQSLQWVPALVVTAAEAGDALATIQSLTIAFLVFTFGSMLVALQVASAQLTPRIIATMLLRDNTIRCTVGLFVFTLHARRRYQGTAARSAAAGDGDGRHLCRHRIDGCVPVPDRLHR